MWLRRRGYVTQLENGRWQRYDRRRRITFSSDGEKLRQCMVCGRYRPYRHTRREGSQVLCRDCWEDEAYAMGNTGVIRDRAEGEIDPNDGDHCSGRGIENTQLLASEFQALASMVNEFIDRLRELSEGK